MYDFKQRSPLTLKLIKFTANILLHNVMYIAVFNT